MSQLLGMITAGNVAIGNLRGSHDHLRVLHEMITFSTNGQRLHESCTLCSESETSVENCALSFWNPLDLLAVVLQ